MFVKPLSELTPPSIEWLWPGYLAVGNLTIFDGDPGLGKSMVTLDLAARITTGRSWPDGAPGPAPATVLFLCSEDPDGLIDARLQSLGADRQRVYVWPRLEEPGLPHFPGDKHRLDEMLAQTGARFVVIDPIMAFWDRNVDTGSDAGVRRAMQPLALLAEKHRCAMVLIRHLNKRNSSNALYRGGASIAFIAACRLAWLAGAEPKMDERCVLAVSKNNFGPKSPSLSYQLPADGPRVEWRGSCEWTADEVVKHHSQPARRRAREFLRTTLADGPRLASDIFVAAKKLRISTKTLRRAKQDLSIRSDRIGGKFGRRDFWHYKEQALPEEPSDTPLADAWLEEWARMYPAPPEWSQDSRDDD
jgi:hypothetical protein